MNVVLQKKHGINGQPPAMMPLSEMAIYPCKWASYSVDSKDDQVTLWMEAFVNALSWIKKDKGKLIFINFPYQINC